MLFCHMGVPYSMCGHPKGEMIILSDTMFFFDASDVCPIEKLTPEEEAEIESKFRLVI